MTRRYGAACGLCNGSGGVWVWAERAHDQMRDGSFWKTKTVTRDGKEVKHRINGHYEMTCACKCAKGDARRGREKRKGSATYDENRHVICHGTHDAESVQALKDFVGAADTVEVEGEGKGRQWEF